MELSNQVALIAGSSSGIGAAIARKFASQGAMCAIVASADIGKATAVAEDVGHGAKGYICDVTDSSQVQRLVDESLAPLFRPVGLGLRESLFL